MNFYQRIVSLSKICTCSGPLPRTNLFVIRYPLYKTQLFYSSRDDTSSVQRRRRTDTFFKSVVANIPFFNIVKSRLKVSGYLLYEGVADKISYADFFQQYSLPDTFYSWFVVTELHIWMLMVRAMQEGENGRYLRNCLVQALWADVQTRVKKLGAANPAEVRSQIDELSQQFQAAIVAYDEGLLSSDKVLASALWRRIFQKECDNPEHLEHLIHYVRKQIKLLEDMSAEEVLNKCQITWISIKCI